MSEKVFVISPRGAGSTKYEVLGVVFRQNMACFHVRHPESGAERDIDMSYHFELYNEGGRFLLQKP